MRLLEIENVESIVDARARVNLNGQEAWISQQMEAGEPPAAVSLQQPARQAVAGVQAPTSAGSRAALLREGVVLNAEAASDNSLAKPDQSPGGGATSQGMSSNEAKQSKATVLMRLR